MSSKQRQKLKEWRRPDEYIANPKMIELVDCYSVKQGWLMTNDHDFQSVSSFQACDWSAVTYPEISLVKTDPLFISSHRLW